MSIWALETYWQSQKTEIPSKKILVHTLFSKPTSLLLQQSPVFQTQLNDKLNFMLLFHSKVDSTQTPLSFTFPHNTITRKAPRVRYGNPTGNAPVPNISNTRTTKINHLDDYC